MSKKKKKISIEVKSLNTLMLEQRRYWTCKPYTTKMPDKTKYSRLRKHKGRGYDE